MVTVSSAVCCSLLQRHCNAKHHLVAHLVQLEECEARRCSKVLAGGSELAGVRTEGRSTGSSSLQWDRRRTLCEQLGW